jgi:hypothetical protein
VPRPIGIIRFDFHLLALFVDSPDVARDLLASMLSQVLTGLGAPRQLSADSVKAWQEWDGDFHATATEKAPPRPISAARTVKAHDVARVRRNLSDVLRTRGLAKASYRDTEAVRFCDHHIAPAMYSMLVDEIATFERRQLIIRGANEAGAALGEHRRRSIELRVGLSTPFADDVRAEESLGDMKLTRWVRAVQIVLELSLSGEGLGGKGVGRVDWERLLAMAESLLEISQIRSQARFLLEPLEIEFDDGQIAIQVGGSSPYSLPAFDVLRRLFQLRPAENSLSDELGQGENSGGEGGSAYERVIHSMSEDRVRDDAPFESLLEHPKCPPKLRLVDQSMRAHLGAGYDAILATLQTAGSWPRDFASEYAVVDGEGLATNIHEWSGLPKSEVRGAIELLTLRTADLRSELHGGVYPYWHLRRKFRSATRPLLEVDAGSIWVVPELAIGAQRLMANYLFDGRLPWPDLPKPLLQLMRNYRETQNHLLEQLAEERLNVAGFTARRALTPKKLRKVGIDIPDAIGEIDVLVADSRRRRLWVIEAKDPEEPFTPNELWSGAQEFKKRYVAQLQRKVIGVTEACAELVTFLGAEPESDWVVRPLFLTSRVELAAFDRRINVPFVVLEDLVELLEESSPPEEGLFLPQWAAASLVGAKEN